MSDTHLGRAHKITELQQLREENERLKKDNPFMTAAPQLIDHLEAQVADLQSRLSAAEKQNKQLSEGLAAYRDKWDESEAKVEQFARKTEQAEKENAELRKAYESDEYAIEQTARLSAAEEAYRIEQETHRRTAGERDALQARLSAAKEAEQVWFRQAMRAEAVVEAANKVRGNDRAWTKEDHDNYEAMLEALRQYEEGK